MKVARLPGTTDINPYQSRFYEALERCGVDLVGTGSLDEAWLRANAGRVDLLHVHWRLVRLVAGSDAAVGLIEPRVRPDPSQVDVAVNGLDLAADLGYRIVWTLHEPEVLRDPDSAEAPIARALLDRVDAVATHDDQATSLIARTRPDVPCASIGLAPCVDDYPVVDREEARAALGLRDEHVVFLAPGGFGPSKQPADLMRAFRSLDAPDARLRWVGPDMCATDDSAELRSLAESDPRVDLDLRTHSTDSFSLALAAADVGVSARRVPWTNSSVVTAGAFGLPVVAADLPVNHQHLGDAGWFFDVSRVESLDDALGDAVTAPDRRERGRRTSVHVTRTTFDDMADAFVELLARIA